MTYHLAERGPRSVSDRAACLLAQDQEDGILYKAKSFFGSARAKLVGHAGAYLLELKPATRELRGKFQGGKLRAETLEEMSSKLDQVIAEVTKLIG